MIHTLKIMAVHAAFTLACVVVLLPLTRALGLSFATYRQILGGAQGAFLMFLLLKWHAKEPRP